MSSRTVPAAALFLALVAAGCGGEPELKFGKVTGDVSLDGAPVENGTVNFYSAQNELLGSGSIEGGKYSTQVMVGEATVRLTSFKKIVVDEKKVKRGYKYTKEELDPEIFPPKYNKDSTLKASIKEGDNKYDFAAQTEPKKKK